MCLLPAFLTLSPLPVLRCSQNWSTCDLRNQNLRVHQQIHCQVSGPDSDVVVVGAGLAGLSTAFELARRGAQVRVLTSPSCKSAALSAGGMLAPNSEAVTGVMLDLCRASLDLYPRFVSDLQDIVPEIDVRLRSCNNFLLPALDGNPLPSPSPGARTLYMNADQAHALEPALGPRVTSMLRCLDDAAVDNRQLIFSLRKACQRLGVRIQETPIRRIIASSGTSLIDAMQTESGDLVRGAHYILANGAWLRNLMPSVPVRPIKGQMLSLSPPPWVSQSDRLEHVLYGKNVYIIPKEDSCIYHVGATVEDVGFSSSNTAGGIAQLLSDAIALVPAFADYDIQETWSGFRPATPDLNPVLGLSEFKNLSIASGFFRNGILLAPIAGQLMASVVLDDGATLTPDSRIFLEAFSPNRFGDPDRAACNGPGAATQNIDRNDEHTIARPSATISNEVLNHKTPQGTQTAESDKVKMYKNLRGESQKPNSDSLPSQNQLTTDELSKSEVLVYRILPDGTREPLLPPPNWEKSTSSMAMEANDHSESSDDSSQFTYKAQVENAENISGENDAYDDVLANRERKDRVEHEKLARSANRAFGRTKSYLEDKEDVPVLSLSAEEVARCDEAFQQGLDDMKIFEKCFDPDDPSVIATRKDLQMLSDENVSSAANGTVPATNGDNGGRAPSNGYF